MIVAVTLATALSAATAQTAPAAQPLERLFLSACFDGSAKLAEGVAQPVAIDAMPASLRRKFGSPSTARVWKLNGTGNAYFYTFQYSQPDMSPNVCGIASDTLGFDSAADTVATALGASRDRETGAVTTEWWHPEAGYMALASRVQPFTVLQVNWLNEDQRRKAIENR